MNRNSASIWVAPYLLLIACVIAGYLWHLGDAGVLRSIATDTQPAETPVAIGGPFSLLDQNGARRTDKDYRGKFMLVFFGYTYCPDVCPTTLAVLSAAMDKLGPEGDQVVPIFITIDPKRDTPEILKAYLAAFGPRFVGLTGTDQDIAPVAKGYRVFFKEHPGSTGADYAVDHSTVIYLMDKNGAFAANYTLETSPDMIAADIRQKIAASR